MGASFKELSAWQKAVEMTLCVYKLTGQFPAAERFGLKDQLRRAAVSVASNIAEGYGRSTTGEYIQFLGNARGSNCEVETQLVIAPALGLGDPQEMKKAENMCAEVSRLLGALIKSLRLRPPRSSSLRP